MLDPLVILSGALTGFVVGLTGMGGGALMTPMLVLLFKVEPLAAVSSDIVASMVMKPVGGAVHWKRGTVHRDLVKWLVMGSIPSAFVGVLLLRQVSSGEALQSSVKVALGIALLVVAVGLCVRPLLTSRHARPADDAPPAVKRLPTLLIGILGGVVVGMTSVGSGSLMMILLLLLYPRLKLSQLVGTDLVQAVPLVASAAIAHLIFGNFKLGITVAIVIGSIPGIFLGAHFSSRAPDYVVRPALVVVLMVTGLKLVGAPLMVVATAVPIAIAGGLFYAIPAARRARAVRRLEQLAVPLGQGAPPAAPDELVRGMVNGR